MVGGIMQPVKPVIMDFESRLNAAEAVAELIANLLAEDLKVSERAVFLSSGGSTPVTTLELLSKKQIEWSKVQVGLVDDRCVPDTHEASNAGLIRNHLLQDAAAPARFEPMIEEMKSLPELSENANARYEGLLPATVSLLGMGLDGHTASWFPGAKNLGAALSETTQTVIGIDATGCPVAGSITDRLTISRSAVAKSNRGILLIFGDEKREVLLNAISKPVSEAPIRAAIEDLGDRLIIAWAP